jgi:UrcA family protein
MTKSRIAMLGSAMMGAALVCGFGLANAQEYNGASPTYYDYHDRPAPADETVIVHPYYDEVQKRQLLGRVDGEINPVELSASRPVSFSDLDLSHEAGYVELHARVRDTARDLCAELDARFPELRGDRDADRECVRTATRNAMHSVLEGAD